ncbi:MAG TPA: lipid-A-disaccharide synthase [Bacteroidetes bacterium]|nr:lipid-A-disaccharide synthase [Bacteroidota bacterium]HEX05074.1 lipid-A-disaccharide synthase [Bacteroidota bacterium]
MRVFWVTGESSGDRHAAHLIRELKQLQPSWTHGGMGGEAMRHEGVELTADLKEAAVMGLTEVIRHLPRLFRLRNRLIDAIVQSGTQLVVLVDFPDFNMSVARSLRVRLGRQIPILYYVSPQVWAWRRGRIKTIARLVDAMAVLFPFEVDVYRPQGLETVFYGHPLVGEVVPSASESELRAQFGLTGDEQAVALLPGSRTQEIGRHLPVQLAAVQKLRARLTEPVKVLLARANTVDHSMLAQMAAGTPDVEIVDNARDALSVARVGLVKSGTSTVEALLIGTPYTVMYIVSPLTYQIAKLLIRGVKHIAMVNVLAGREIVPERVQDAATPERLASDLEQLWDGEGREQQQKRLAEVAASLGEPGATKRLAAWISERFNK